MKKRGAALALPRFFFAEFFNISETLMKPAGNIISVSLAIISMLFHSKTWVSGRPHGVAPTTISP